jgi:hypothetical protein
MKIANLALLAVLTGGLFACHKKAKPESGYINFRPDEAFELKYGGAASLEGGNLKLTFTAVPEDSRCPEYVNCVWEGEVKISVAVIGSGVNKTLEFVRKAKEKSNTVQAAGDYKIMLSEVSPYPKQQQKIKPEDYRIRLLVKKA